MMRLRILFAILVLTVAARSAPAQWWSVGPKLGYTFGADGGVTIGAEASYFPNESNAVYPYGFTIDINSWAGHLSLHAGAESWYLIGVDIGPTLFFSQKGVNFGMSLIAWDGVFLYPYYEMGIQFNGEIFNGVGGYLKFPLGGWTYAPAWGPIGPVG